MARMLARGRTLTALCAGACIETSVIAAANESARRDGGTLISRQRTRPCSREDSIGRASRSRARVRGRRSARQPGRPRVGHAPRTTRTPCGLDARDPPALGDDSPMDVWTEKLSRSDRALRRHEPSVTFHGKSRALSSSSTAVMSELRIASTIDEFVTHARRSRARE
jgi:hypothetical protein